MSGTKKWIVLGEPYYRPGIGLIPVGGTVDLPEGEGVPKRWKPFVEPTVAESTEASGGEPAQPQKKGKRPSDSSPA